MKMESLLAVVRPAHSKCMRLVGLLVWAAGPLSGHVLTCCPLAEGKSSRTGERWAFFACFVCPALHFRRTEPLCVSVYVIGGGCMCDAVTVATVATGAAMPAVMTRRLLSC